MSYFVKNFLRLFSIASLGLVSHSTHGDEHQQASWVPAITTEYLENGLLVSIYEDQRMPLVSVQLVYSIGSAHEDENSRGLAHLFEHLMFSATKNYPERAVFNYVEQFGGSTNATTSFDETNYFATVPPDRWVHVLEVYADRMVNLFLTDDDLTRDKKIVLEELRVNAQNDPISRLGFEALKVGFGNHPYSISPLGTEEDVSNATLARCLGFYEKYYGPKNAHLILAGALDTRNALAVVQKLFGGIEKNVESPRQVPPLDDWDFPAEINLSEDIPPVEVGAFLYLLPPATSDDHLATNMMVSLLSGLDGFADEIVHNRGRALYAQSFDLLTKAGRMMAFGSVSLPYRRKEAAYRYLEETLEDLGDFGWLNEESLNAEKRRYLQVEYGVRLRAGSMGSRIRFAEDWQEDIERAFNREERINAVGTEDIKRVYRQYVMDAEPVKVYVEPDRVPWYVTVFGRLYPIASKLGLVGFGL